ncbi:glutathione ABC transporter substrate-binding protein [Virgibacillus sp. NKC19-3]|uniref:glutathione ABC transporter substrate-binding protein n=1 Tax=Virgibacillus saliphilus TaxID=2831674 RepID=UPI001C9A73E0|nr:glutathione ABC transporter substrate-binding protein [Virgibacillus sp. NKC19-3]MBY7143157.1 glutathione ABC transporter substrate-binding protein [Virgibacillus sp. NKC19-3]
MKKSKNSVLMLLLILGMVLAACASEPDDASDTTEEGGEGQNGGDLVITTASDAVSLDPTGANDVPSFDVQYNIFENLVKQDENMELEPGLAKSWETVDDHTWEFKLQEGVTFHDGSAFNAEVVKANLERVMDPDVAAPAAYLIDMISDIEVVDDYTIRLTTEYPFGSLPANLTHSTTAMVSQEQIEEDYTAMEQGEEPGSVINQHPIGTGYFTFEEWDPGQQIQLTKNEDYWDKEALLDSVTFKVVQEDLTRIAELETGESHITNPLSPSDIEQVESADDLSVDRQGSVSLDYIGFNMEKEPFDDERVRRAISMAVDKEQIVEGIYNGVGTPAVGPLAPNVFGYDEELDGIEYDPEAAQELLAEAGYENGFSTTIWTNDSRERVDLATNVQSQLEEIGVDVDIEVLEWGAYIEQTGNGDHDMFVLGWSNSTADADIGLYPLFHSDNVGVPGNRTYIQDDEIDALIDEGRQATNEDERLEIYSEAQEKLVETAPMIYTLHQEYLLGVREEVKGLTQLPTKILQLKDVYIEE